MRKDVRLGLAVGSILFGVVLGYVVFIAGGAKPDGGEQAMAATNSPSGAQPYADNSLLPDQRPESPDPVVVSPPTVPFELSPSGDEADALTGSTFRTAGEEETAPVALEGGRVALDDEPVGSAAGGRGWDWGEALERGIARPLLGRTITPESGDDRAPFNARVRDTEVARDISAGRDEPSPSRSASADPVRSIPESATGPRSYIVKPGESFWSIAKSEYGNAAYYPHLVRANPRIDPSKLKAGATIILPGRNEVIPPSSERASAPAPAPIDARSQYRVQPGDNLYAISKKLYGRTDMVDELYRLNEQVIGPNPSVLKQNMVLKLPSPPTQTEAVGILR